MYQLNKIRYKAIGSPMAVSVLFGLYAVGKASILYPIEARGTIDLLHTGQGPVSRGAPSAWWPECSQHA